MRNESTSEKEIIYFLVGNSIYPMISKKGKVFLKLPKKNCISEDKTKEIIKQLNVKTADGCKQIRNEVKKRASELRENLPIKKWIKEERPREMLISSGPESLSLSKLLAIILRIGKEGTSAEELSKRLLNLLVISSMNFIKFGIMFHIIVIFQNEH